MRGETDDDFRARMEAKSARTRRFEQLEIERAGSQAPRQAAVRRKPVERKPKSKSIRVTRPSPVVDPAEASAAASAKLAYLKAWRERKAGRPTGPAPIKEIPLACRLCQRPMRGRGRNERPDGVTVQHASKGRCNNCMRNIAKGHLPDE